MYHPGKTQPNNCLASLQRTFYPKHTTYYGNGTGRDLQVIYNNGSLDKVERAGFQTNHGVQLRQHAYKALGRSCSPPPGKKDAPTWYYQSDGSGRDSYVL